MKSVKKTLGVFGGRAAFTISILAIAFLTACGGGGGSTVATGGSVITPPAQALSIIASAPVVSNISVAGTQATAGLSAEFTPVNFVNPTAASFTSSTGTGATFTCSGVSVSQNVRVPTFTITQVTGTPKFVATSSFTVTGLPAPSNCIFSLPLTIASSGVVSNPVTISFPFTTAAAPTCSGTSKPNAFGVCISPPATAGYTWNQVLGGGVWESDDELFTNGALTRTGTLVSGANQMSSGCQNIGDDVWLKDSASGKIKYIKSAVKGDTEQLSFAYYQSCASLPGTQAGVYVLVPMYSNKLATSPSTSLNVSNGGLTTPITEAKGTDIGVKAKILSSDGIGFWVLTLNAQKSFVFTPIQGPL